MRFIVFINFITLALAQNTTLLSTFTQYSSAQTPKKNSIVQAFALFTSNPQFKALLLSTNPSTLFAPTDAAIQLAQSAVPKNDTFLFALFSFHLLPTKFTPSVARIVSQTFLTTQGPGLNQLGGQAQSLVLNTDTNGSIVQFGLGTSKIVESIDFGAGVIHIIDTVFTMPIPLIQSLVLGNFRGIVGLLGKADDGSGNVSQKVGQLQGITLVGPFNGAVSAFQSQCGSLSPATLAQIVAMHILPGVTYSTDLLKAVGKSWIVQSQSQVNINVTVSLTGKITMQGPGNVVPINLIAADYTTDNGVFHVLDGVLLPNIPALLSSKNSADVRITQGEAGLLIAIICLFLV